MDEYLVKISDKAHKQLIEIGEYIAHTLQARTTAINFVSTLETEILSLSTFPNRFPVSEETIGAQNVLRKMPVGSFLVYYQVVDSSRTVEVAAIVYGRRDQKQVLTELLD